MANYDFSNSKLIVSIGADFLGDWQGGGFDCSYAKGRVPNNGVMSRHIQFESNMTLSGANADLRVPLKINEQKLVLLEIYKSLVGKNKISIKSDQVLSNKIDKIVKQTIAEIKSSKQGAVIVSGLKDEKYQSLVLEINEKIKSKSYLPHETIYKRNGKDEDVNGLIQEMSKGNIGALIMHGVNPVYTLSNSKGFSDALQKIDLSICFSTKNDETALKTKYVAATNHYLESWGDYELTYKDFSLAHPVIKTLFDTKHF